MTWMHAGELRRRLIDVGASEDEAVKLIVWECMSRRLIASAFRHMLVGDAFPSPNLHRVDDDDVKRTMVGVHLWRVLDRANRKERFTVTTNWADGFFAFGFQIEPTDEFPYRSDRYESLMFDAAAAEALVRRCEVRQQTTVLTDSEIIAWITEMKTAGRVPNKEQAWVLLGVTFGKHRRGKKARFENLFKAIIGRSPGRPRKAARQAG